MIPEDGLNAIIPDYIKRGFDEEVLEWAFRMPSSHRIFLKARDWKVEGNVLYNKGLFIDAVDRYEKAFRLLACCLPGDYDEVAIRQETAVSLNLNLAACGLKLGNFEQVIKLCSLVLEEDKYNAKALFRRAIAFKKLNHREKAIEDFRSVSKVEPKNKEVLKEISLLESAKDPKEIGKKGDLGYEAPISQSKLGKVTEVSTEDGSCISYESMDISGSDQEGDSQVMEVGSNPEVPFSDSTKTSMTRVEDRIGVDSTQSPAHSRVFSRPGDDKRDAKSPYRFVNHKKRASNIIVARQTYESLLAGKPIMFAKTTSLEVMTIKILHKEEKSNMGCELNSPSSVMDLDMDLLVVDQESRKEFGQCDEQCSLSAITQEQGTSKEVLGGGESEETDDDIQSNILEDSVDSQERRSGGVTLGHCWKRFKRMIKPRVPKKKQPHTIVRKKVNCCKSRPSSRTMRLDMKRKQENLIFDEVQYFSKKRPRRTCYSDSSSYRRFMFSSVSWCNNTLLNDAVSCQGGP